MSSNAPWDAKYGRYTRSIDAASGAVPDAAAVPNFCTNCAEGMMLTFTCALCDLLKASASVFMNCFWVSRAHTVTVPVAGPDVASLPESPPPPQAATTSADNSDRARTASLFTRTAPLLLEWFDRRDAATGDWTT